MKSIRQTLKKAIPAPIRRALIAARTAIEPPALENIVLHDYIALPDCGPLRLTLVIPSISPAKAFGGVLTGLDIFFGICVRLDAEVRLVLDDFGKLPDRRILDRRCIAAGLDPDRVTILTRADETPSLAVRANDWFFSFNWWTTLNVQRLLAQQSALFAVHRPCIYIVQEYEPFLYPFSSTHMIARQALQSGWPTWAIINTPELDEYMRLQGHAFAQKFTFEPQISDVLQPFLELPPVTKKKRVLIYGRPSIARNCYDAAINGLRYWHINYPEYGDWELVSAGLPHPAVRIGTGRSMQSLGKLALDDYAELLRTTAAGLSLMASPHPSYPPMEMAHFGVLTVTNSYLNKDLSRSHGNIMSISDISAEAIGGALGAVCARFEASPNSGWSAPSARPAFRYGEAVPVSEKIAYQIRVAMLAESPI